MTPFPTPTPIADVTSSISRYRGDHPVIVTTCARSGSKYAAAALYKLTGLPFTHERAFNLAVVKELGWPQPHKGRLTERVLKTSVSAPVRDVSWLAAASPEPFPNNTLHIHLVRNPLRTIESIARRGFLFRGRYQQPDPYGQWAIEVMREHQALSDSRLEPRYSMSMLSIAAEYYCRWHTLGLALKPHYIIRVEDLTTHLEAVLRAKSEEAFFLWKNQFGRQFNGGGVGDRWPNVRLEALDQLPESAAKYVAVMNEGAYLLVSGVGDAG